MSKIDRRRFLHWSAAAATLPVLAGVAPVAAQAMPHLEETDPTASALGYRHDTTKVDAAKYPTHKPDQICAGCKLALAPQPDGWLPCTIFPGKSVAPKGWCAAYAPKA